ncbi:tRNA dihydrouridine synthase DusB [uncultured Nitratireductor sp.]|mgnify:CR=1 FL=1|uniref:tRNA dihydrouridine synthase DusB n=1 Tax=uncultured Nitratireductor sp. TaxID=520953 RepID=UPI0025D569E7|nr:tRNA dihydrouridine synthase DusB [uncultured Nitratireductor sp.]
MCISAADFLSTPLSVGGVAIRNRVFLAPMSGVTDLAFRARAYEHGAGLVVSEMVASGELARGKAESARRLRRPDVDVHMVQLAGREAHWMAEGARIAEAQGADIIDINMGCPAKKVTGGYSGSALMREPAHALSLIEAVVGAVQIPVTVKMRLGWDENTLNAPEIAKRAEDAGVAMVTVHGRTRCQFYKGKADWAAISDVKNAVRIPVVANGDVTSADDAAGLLEASGADAVMVGRAHYGAPWIAGVVASNTQRRPDNLADYVIDHYQAMLALYGTEHGTRHARKHLGWYMDRHLTEVAPATRKAIMTGTDHRDVSRLLQDLFRRQEDRLAA